MSLGTDESVSKISADVVNQVCNSLSGILIVLLILLEFNDIQRKIHINHITIYMYFLKYVNMLFFFHLLDFDFNTDIS